MVERRFLVAALPEVGGEITLREEAAAHAAVLRLAEGDAVVLFDGRGGQMDARVVAIDRRSVRCVATEMREHVRVGPRLVLCQCLPKGKKLDAIVRAATEIGVDAIHLVSSARSVPRPGEDRGGARTDRLRRIAEEATRQSLGTLVPTIHAPRPLAEVVRRAPPGACRLAFVPDAAGTLVGLGAADEAWVLIGPEGGLDPKEIDDAVEVGFLATRLFDTVLRVETAAPVALGMVRLAITR